MNKEIARGAEAVIYLEDGDVFKKRFKKSYRISLIDDKLRKSRTKREAKVIDRLNSLKIDSPALIDSDSKEIIQMEYIEGVKLRDHLDAKNFSKICRKLGEMIKQLHENGIIHGDLTTSNFIFKDGKIYFIDFGLSFFSQKAEDRAVDLHLLRQALESKHYQFWQEAFEQVIIGYNDKEVEKRLEKVEERGRNKHKH